jgi:hypothetical protein
MPNSMPIVKIQPGMILMDKISLLPYYRETMPRLFIQVNRIMPKMLDVMYMATDAPTDHQRVRLQTGGQRSACKPGIGTGSVAGRTVPVQLRWRL